MKSIKNKLLGIALILVLIIQTININTYISYADQTVWEFNYNGGIQSFVAPSTAMYKIEAYGASGGVSSNLTNYGSGGYSYGNIVLKQGEQLYITVGGKGTISSGGSVAGGYNGGGAASGNNTGSGGGCTLVAFQSGTLAELSDSNVVMVAGGGGGKSMNSQGINMGGSGGGSEGGSTTHASGGTQTSGYSRGQGQPGSYGIGGGGGGYYGGYASASQSAGSGGGSGYINESRLNNYSTGMTNWFNKHGYVKITYIGEAKTTVTVSTGSNGKINDETSYSVTGVVGTTITIPDPTVNESWINFDGYVITGGDGILNGNDFTFGYEDTYIDATYSGESVTMDVVQNGGKADVTVSAGSVAKQLIQLKGKTDTATNWSVLGTYAVGDYSRLINKTATSCSNGNSATYTVLLPGIYEVALVGGGAGQDGGYRGGSGAKLTFTCHLNENDIMKLKAGSPGQDSDSNRGWKSGGSGWNSGGSGYWSGGGGGSSGISVNNSTLAIAAGGGGGNWKTGYGGRTSNNNSGNYGNAGGSNGQNGYHDSNGNDSAGGGAGWYGGKQGISESYSGARGAYGGRNGYNSSLVGGFLSVSETAGANGGGRNSGSASIKPVSFDVPLAQANATDIITIDIIDAKAPDTPSLSFISKYELDGVTLNFQKTQDYGGKYYLQIPNFTDIKELSYTSGFKGWNYAITESSTYTVTATNSTFTSTQEFKVSSSNEGKYVHVAAVDFSGNISETYSFYIPNSVGIQYNRNDAQNNPTTESFGLINGQKIIVGSSLTLKNNETNTLSGDEKFVREGYIVTGWNTKADGTGTAFDFGQTVTYDYMKDNFGYNVILYAQWKPIEYNVTFEPNHATSHTGDTTHKDSSYRMNGMTNIKFDEIVQLPSNEYIREYYIEYRNAEPWLTDLKSTNGTKNASSQWVQYQFVGWSKSTALGSIPYYKFNDDNSLTLNSFKLSATETDIANTDKSLYFADKTFLRNLTSTQDATVKLYAAWNTGKTVLPSAVTGSEGHTFIDWSDKPYPDDRIYDMKVNNNKDSNDKTVKKGTDYTPSKDTVLYAHWYHQVHLTFNLNGGTYQGSPNNIVATGTLYDYEKDYTFGIFNNKTNVSKGHYDTQNNSKDIYNNEINVDAYGTYDGNGLNSLYTKIGENGEQYRLLGWSKNPNALVPDEGLCVYSETRATKYKISTDTTLYAVWEPILEVNVSVQRTLGDLKFTDVSSPITSAKAITVASAIQRLSVIAKPGEQCQYTLATKGTDSRKANVYFDTKITDIYDINGLWTDDLNPSTSEDLILDPPQKHGLNRTFNLSSDYIMRKFYIPLYLGTSQSYPGNSGIKEYVMFIEIQQDSYYYSLKGSKETIVIPVNIYITNDKPSGSGGTGGEYTDEKIISVLDELRSRLRVRLQ